MQKAYKIRITHIDSSMPNYREIVVSAYTSYRELHQIIQILFGLQNCHLWEFRDFNKTTCISIDEEIEDEYMAIDKNIDFYDANNILLANGFLSKTFKKFRYIYDYGIWQEFLVEYKGLDKTENTSIIEQNGFLLLENIPIFEQEDMMKTYEQKNRKNMKNEMFDDWLSFEKYIKYVYNLITEKALIKKLRKLWPQMVYV